MEQSPSGMLKVTQLAKKLATFHGDQWFITIFTGAHH